MKSMKKSSGRLAWWSFIFHTLWLPWISRIYGRRQLDSKDRKVFSLSSGQGNLVNNMQLLLITIMTDTVCSHRISELFKCCWEIAAAKFGLNEKRPAVSFSLQKKRCMSTFWNTCTFKKLFSFISDKRRNRPAKKLRTDLAAKQTEREANCRVTNFYF